MDDSFDPYFHWLGIPPHEQPPHLYRLLGLAAYEPDGGAILQAVDRAAALLGAQCAGPYSQHAMQLIAEVQAARQCLLDPQAKAIYDHQLAALAAQQQQLMPQQQQPLSLESTPTAAQQPLSLEATPTAAQPPLSLEATPAAAQPPTPDAQPQILPAVSPTALTPTPTPTPSPAAPVPTADPAKRPVPLRPQPVAASPARDDSRSAANLPTKVVSSSNNKSAKSRSPKESQPLVEVGKIVGGGLAGTVLALLVLWFGLGLDPLHIFSSGKAPQPPRQAKADTSKGASSNNSAGANAARPASTPGDVSPPNTTSPSDPTSPGTGTSAEDPVATPAADADTMKSAGNADTAPAAGPGSGGPDAAASSEPAADASPAAARRRPVPSAEQQAAKQALIEEVFARQLADAESDPAKGARFFLDQAEDLEREPAAQFMALKQAFVLAGAAPAINLGQQAIRALTTKFEMDEQPLQLYYVQLLSRKVRTTEDRTQLGRMSLQLARRLQAEKLYGEVERLGRICETQALKIRDPELRIAAKRILQSNSVRRRKASQLESLAKSLAADPENPQLNTDYGVALCLIENDWPKGLPRLAKGNLPELKEAAELDLKRPTKVAGQLAVADSWYALAESNPQWEDFFHRAGHWYRSAGQAATGLNKAKAVRRLAAIADMDLSAMAGGADAEPAAADAAPPPVLAGAKFAPALIATLDNVSSAVGPVLSTDGQLLMGLNLAGMVEVWEAASGKSKGVLPMPANIGRPVRLAAGPDNRVACGTTVGAVVVWDVQDLRIQSQFVAHDTELRDIEVSQKGGVLVTIDDSHYKAWSLAGRSFGGSQLPLTPMSVSLSADAQLVAVSMGDSRTRPGTAGANGALLLWNASRNAAVFTQTFNTYLTWVAISPDGRQLAYAVGDRFTGRGEVMVLDTKSRSLLARLAVGSPLYGLVFSAKGDLLFTADTTGVAAWKTSDFERAGRIKAASLRRFALSGDGKYAAVLDSTVHVIRLYGGAGPGGAPAAGMAGGTLALPETTSSSPPGFRPSFGPRPSLPPGAMPPSLPNRGLPPAGPASPMAPPSGAGAPMAPPTGANRSPAGATGSSRPAPTATAPHGGVATPTRSAPDVAIGTTPPPPPGPWENLPQHIVLPSLLDSKPQTLFPVPLAGGPLQLELDDALADLPASHRIESRVHPAAADRWQVLLQGGVETTIAEFAYRDGKLLFVWRVGSSKLAAQLSNCLLRIASGGQIREIALRSPKRGGSLAIALQKDVNVHPLPLTDPPRRELLKLEVGGLPPEDSLRNDRYQAAVGQFVVLELLDSPGVEIRLRVILRGNEYQVTVEPYYVQPKLELSLSLDRLAVMTEAAEKQLLKSQRDLVRSTAELGPLRVQYANIQSRSAVTEFDRVAKNTAMFEVGGKVEALTRKIQSLQLKIPQLEAKLEQIPQWQSLLESLNGQPLRLQLVAESKTRRLPLYVLAD